MNILVVDVAAVEGGALTILKLFRDRLSEDKDNHYFFCVSRAEISDTDNITVLTFPWAKKSWFHRLWFDYHVCRGLLRQYGIEKIISLQNTAVPRVAVPQMIYLHQPLPFVEYRFRLTDNPRLWCYQNIISRLILSSLKRADSITVQTHWMKKAVIERAGISEDRITVEPPPVELKAGARFSQSEWKGELFYPASNIPYKNHILLFKALAYLKEKKTPVPTLFLTLTEEQLPGDCAALYPSLKEHIVLLGSLPREEVLRQYGKSALVFPSYIETYGLPLLEAKNAGCPILASDCAFSHEILSDYPQARFFDPFSTAGLADAIESIEVELH